MRLSMFDRNMNAGMIKTNIKYLVGNTIKK